MCVLSTLISTICGQKKSETDLSQFYFCKYYWHKETYKRSGKIYNSISTVNTLRCTALRKSSSKKSPPEFLLEGFRAREKK